ncbi:hypothetical protein ACFWCB_26215 [Streptomyces sp. NPDC060048]|uniref:hypothetical protein n=1 Tax=unclassified Streptomyces TaxID=2593676 RepID=UPI0036CB9380
MPAPTPLDVATHTLRLGGALGSSFRGRFQQGIRISPMNPHTRLVALTLASLASDSGEIDKAMQPGLHGLAASTGLTAGQVAIQLRILESRRWLESLQGIPYETAEFRLRLPQFGRARPRE